MNFSNLFTHSQLQEDGLDLPLIVSAAGSQIVCTWFFFRVICIFKSATKGVIKIEFKGQTKT